MLLALNSNAVFAAAPPPGVGGIYGNGFLAAAALGKFIYFRLRSVAAAAAAGQSLGLAPPTIEGKEGCGDGARLG